MSSDDLQKWMGLIRQRIDFNQRLDNPLVIHFEHDATGFGAQVSRRILAFRIGLITGARVGFPMETMFPYELPFEPIKGSDIAVEGNVVDPFECPEVGVYCFDFWGFWDRTDLRDRVIKGSPLPGPTVNVDLDLLLEGIILERFRLNDKYSKLLKAHADRMQLPDNYIGVHYRRGDKTAETPYVPASVYRQRILDLVKISGVNSIYLASDSPAAVHELDLESAGVCVHFDDQERRLNNANHRYLMANQNEAGLETDTAIKNIFLLGGGAGLVGQSNAHFATLAAAMVSVRDVQTKVPQIVLIPGDLLLLKRPEIRFFYGLKKLVRIIGKGLLPGRTLKARAKKNG